MEKKKLVDVNIPVYHSTEKLKELLHRLVTQTYKINQIILLHTEDQRDLGWAGEVCRDVPVKEVAESAAAFDYGNTRDKGLQLSEAEIVVFMTQDAIPADEWMIEHLVKSMEEGPEIAVSYARQIADDTCSEIERFTRTFNYPAESRVKSKADLEELGIKTYFCSNVCAAYKREIYQKLGGFEKRIIFNEDMVYAAKVINQGYRIAYEAKAVVIHFHDYSPIQFLRRNFDLGVSQKCYPEIFETVKSESEGIRLVKETGKYLIQIKKAYQIPELLLKSGCKYMGYQFGKHYRMFPKCIIKKLTTNSAYWGGR